MNDIEIITSTENPERIVAITYYISQGYTTEEAMRMSNDTDKVKEILDDVIVNSRYDVLEHINITIRINKPMKHLFNDKMVITLNGSEIHSIYEKYNIYSKEDRLVLDELLDELNKVSPYIFENIKTKAQV